MSSADGLGGIMSEVKKFYWLKLKSDFFNSKRIKKLRRMAGGDTYTIIYLKMQLAALKTDGVLQWTGVEDDFASELALDLDERSEDVQMTLAFLLAQGLIETSNGESYFLPWVVENTGSETDAAERMRKMRERNNVTPMLQGSYTEIEKEKNTEKHTETRANNKIFQEFAAGDSELLDALKEFDSFRKQLKKPLTDRAKSRLVNKLQTFPREDWVAILQKSIDKGWTDVYPIDNKPQKAAAKPINRVFTPTEF